jgi:hypothetical protein
MEEKKKWHEISDDQLESQMLRHKIMHDEPISKAGAMVYKALDAVLERLGVNLDGDIKAQQEYFGIYVTPMGEEWPQKVRGLTVSRKMSAGADPDIMPFAWVSEARIEKSGDIYCDVQLFETNELLQYHCGVNILKVE